MSDRNDAPNTQGDPDLNTDADTASGGAPEETSSETGTDDTAGFGGGSHGDDTVDEQGRPVDNPSGG